MDTPFTKSREIVSSAASETLQLAAFEHGHDVCLRRGPKLAQRRASGGTSSPRVKVFVGRRPPDRTP